MGTVSTRFAQLGGGLVRPLSVLWLLAVLSPIMARAEDAPANQTEPVLTVPTAMTPDALEAFDEQLAKLGRHPDWDTLLAGLSGPVDDPTVRYARSLTMMMRGAVWQGEQGQAGLEALHSELAARPDRDAKIVAAHVLLALGRGQLAVDHNPDGLATLERAVSDLRALGHDRGLVRALYALALAKLHASRLPTDALPVINELMVVADRAKAERYREAATRLYRDWRRVPDEVDDYFGRAKERLQTFPPSLGIPVDADLVAVDAGVLLMNGDTDDQMFRAPPELVRFDGLFVRKLKLPDDTLELRGSTLDADGLLWLATNRGVYNFDGSHFRHLVNPDLPDEDGNELSEKLAAEGDGVPRVAVPLRSNIINEIKQAPDGPMVMATAAGLATFDPLTQLWTFVGSDSAPIPKVIERVAPAPDGSLVVAWRHAYAVRSPTGQWTKGRFVFPTLKGEEHGHLYGLLVDRDGHPWVHGLVGALRLDGDVVIRRVDRRCSTMTRNVNHVLHASDGAWWFATPEGVCRQEGQGCAALNAKRWLPAQWALDLLEWPAGDVWVSVYQGGLHRLIGPHYRQVGLPDGFMQPINSDLIELDGKLFFGNSNGLTRLDPRTGRIDNFRTGNEGMPRGNFMTDLVIRLQTGKLLYTGRGLNSYHDLGLFDGRASEIFGRAAGLPDEELEAACERSPGVVLLAWASGLKEFDTEAGTTRSAQGLAGLAGKKIGQLVCAPGEPVWAFTRDDELFVERDGDVHRLDLAGLGLAGKPQLALRDERAGRFIVGERGILRHADGRWQPLALDPDAFDFRVRDVELDDAGRLYVSTESGVYVTDGETWTLLTSADGLISDTAFDLLWRDGALWVAGHGGAVAWRWPPQEAPETWVLVAGQALSADPDGRLRRLWISDGVEKKGRVVLRSTAGLFELPEDRIEPFLPSDPKAAANAVRHLGEDVPGETLRVERDQLSVEVTAAVPYRDDGPDELTYFSRLDDGPWQRVTGRRVELSDLADGVHRLEVRATDRRLVRDTTPASLEFKVDTPVPTWQVAAAGLLGVFLIFLGRRRIARGIRRFQHRGYRPIEPSPFCPDRPATGSAFVDRTVALDELTGLVNNGGVAVLWGVRGAGKHSLMRRLTESLRQHETLVVELDLATAAAGGDLAAMLQQASARLMERASLHGVDLSGAMGESLLVDASQASLDLTPVPPGATPSVKEASTRSGPGSSGSGEGNPFAHFSRLLKRWETSQPEIRVALLLDNAEMLSVAMDADAAYGSYFFPFLRSLVQQRSRVAVVLAMEGRWFELAHRFESLFSFATPVALPAFDQQTSTDLLTGALADRAWLPEEELAELVALSGGQPYLLQLIGDRLVGGLNASRTNICRLKHVVGVADALVDDRDGRLKGNWLSLERDEKLVVAALSEGAEAPQPAEQIAATLDVAGGKLLYEEARRALLSLSKDGLVERIGEGFRIRARLFAMWVQRHHTVASVLEESVETVAHYQLLQKLGAGGMGIVYKARDLVRGRTLAVKLLRAELSESKRSRLRFLREARLGKRLKHPNIVQILDYGEQGGRLYLAMELLEGVSLARWIRRNRPVGLRRAVEIGRHICSALAAVHDLGVVHRDVKGDNVMVQPDALAAEGALLPGAVRLMDFGLAVGDDVSRMTKAGTMLGTLAYMAPEQARGTEADRRSDLYSLGVVLFELCAGRPPFVGPETAVLNAVLNEPVPPVTELRPEVPEALAALIARLLSKEPDDRPSYAGEVENALEALEKELPVDAPRSADALAATPGSVASGAHTRALNTAGMLDEAGRSQLRSRSIEVLKLESALLTSLSTAGDSSLISATDSTVGSLLDAPEQDGARQLLYWVSAQVARGALDDDRLRDCLSRVAEGVWSTRGLLALVGEEGVGLAGRVAVGLSGSELGQLPFFGDLMRRCVDQRMGLTFFGQYEGATGEGDHDVGAALCAPIWSGDSILGAMLFDRPGDSARPFEDADLELLVCVGYLVGLGLERERLYRQVLDKERLAAVGNMLAGVAHDMKNPMAVISGYAELMADIPEVGERQKYGDVIRRQVTEMSEMVANLMAYARGDRSLSPVAIELAGLADEVRETLGLQCEPKGIELVVDADKGRVQVDANRVKRILFNLGRNALEALDDGGRLLIQIRTDNGGLALKVRDNGPGIPEQIRASLFEPFVTHGKRGGTGLGLAIVKRFVGDHGGTIEVDSQPGQGTTFQVKLPSVMD